MAVEAKVSETMRRQGLPPAPRQPQFHWTTEREAELTKMFMDGLSNRQISQKMKGLSDGSVSAKIKALQEAGRLPRKERITSQLSRNFGIVKKERSAQHLLEEIVELKSMQCRFPIGDLHSPEFHFCKNQRRDVMTSYCSEHHDLCWRPLYDRKR